MNERALVPNAPTAMGTSEAAIASFASLAMGKSGNIALERKFLGVMQEAFEIWCDRQRKYGMGNIAEFGSFGCLVRASDKKARLREHYTNTTKEVFADETVTDSWLDLLNYAVMGLLCERKQWNSESGKSPWADFKGTLHIDKAFPIPAGGYASHDR